MSSYIFPVQNSCDSVASPSHDCWGDPPALIYPDASSPASSATSSSTSPSTPGSASEPEPAQQQVQGHIPRPRNAFIIFRSYFYARAREMKNEDSINQNALSCAAAAAWKELPEDGKKTFRIQAEEEKLMHYKKHPNYVYTPLNRAVKRAQKKTGKTASKDAKRSAKKHRSSLSRRSRKAESVRSTSQPSSSDDSSRDNSASEFVRQDYMPHLKLDQDEEYCDDSKTDGESQKRVDLQFGQRLDVTYTQLPPTPTKETVPQLTLDYSPINSELSTNSDVLPPYHNPGYPNWMYNEIMGYGAPDTGLHAGWNPLQMTLNSYGDGYFNQNQSSNDFDDHSQYVHYDNMDTANTSDYSIWKTTGADDTAYDDGNWIGL